MTQINVLKSTWAGMITKSFRSIYTDNTLSRVVKGIFVTRDRPFFPVKCEMANFFPVNRDFHSRREP